MTTIAFDGKYIAADGRTTTSGGVITNDNTDKFHYRGADIFVMCGSVVDINSFLADFSEGAKTKIDDGVGGFLVRNGNVFIVYVSAGVFCSRINTTAWADGSGRDWAVAAMDHGKDATNAIKYAMTRDSCTGGAIKVLDLKTMKISVAK